MSLKLKYPQPGWACPYCTEPVGYLGRGLAWFFGTQMHGCDFSNVDREATALAFIKAHTEKEKDTEIMEIITRLRKLAAHAGMILTDPPRPTESAAAMTEAADLLEKIFEPKEIVMLKPSHDLPFRERDIRRGLILFRTSDNARGYVNFEMLTGKVEDLPEPAKLELASIMDSLSEELRLAVNRANKQAEEKSHE